MSNKQLQYQYNTIIQELCDFYEVNVLAYVLLGFVSFVISQFCCLGDYKGYYYKNKDE